MTSLKDGWTDRKSLSNYSNPLPILCGMVNKGSNVIIIIIHTHAHIIQCNTVTCVHPPTQLLHNPVVTVTESDIPKIEGQSIAYTCPSGFILAGPNASVCTGDRVWEPDPGEVKCIGNYTMDTEFLFNV